MPGRVESIGQVWKLTWDTLVLKPKKGPPLESAPHGEVLHSGDGTLEIKGLVLASGAGLIYADRARLRWPRVDVVVRTNDLGSPRV